LVVASAISGIIAATLPPPALAASADTSPTGMVAFFPQSECPVGWEPATYAQGRLLLGVTDLTTYTLGKQVGAALANLTAPSHEHAFAVTLTLSEKEEGWGVCGGGNEEGAAKGTYTVNGPALHNDPDLPLFQILACEKKGSGQSPPPTDGYGTAAVAFFNLESCPTNWTPATDSIGNAINGNFVLPFETAPDGTVGTVVGTPYSNGEERKHEHSLSSSISLNSTQYESAIVPAKCDDLTSDGTHDFSGKTKAAFNNVPYTQLLLCERDPNLSAANPPAGVPTNVVTFFGSQNCPYGWKPSATGSGRFMVGLPDGGTQNEAFGSGNPLTAPGDRPEHSHGLNGSVTISHKNVALAAGTDSPIFGKHGTYNYGGHTDYSDFGLPYLTAANCQPCVENDSNPVCQQQAPK
jgi:hypothetical protein